MKTIIEFDEKDYGFFLSTTKSLASICISKENGEILLFEGDGEDCFNQLGIASENFKSFSLDDSSGDVFLNFLEIKHCIGNAVNIMPEARAWIKKCNKYISDINSKH